jgi:hypothetical protein
VERRKKHDDDLFADIVAYVRGQPHKIPPLPELQQVGREYFARAPGSDTWVSSHDLPDATRDAIWKRFENTKGAMLRIGIDADGQLRMTGFPPV